MIVTILFYSAVNWWWQWLLMFYGAHVFCS